MNNRATSKNHIVFILAVITGVLIWMLSPLITGQQEPWDAEGPYYFAALFIGGALFGAICPVKVYRWVLAIYIGQLLALIFVGMGPLIAIGVFFLAGYSLIALVGALSTATLITMLRSHNV